MVARRRMKSLSTGTHLRRQMGQSLEFRDYRHWVPGDDVRHVDWVISSRQGGRPGLDRLLVKRFATEDRLRMVVVIDSRDTMRLPAAMPKLRHAGWLAEALARLAGAERDQCFLTAPWAGGMTPLEIRQTSGAGQITPWLARLWDAPDQQRANLTTTFNMLGPAALLVIISDLYGQDDSNDMTRLIARGRAGNAEMFLVDLDSWPHERAILTDRAHAIDGPGLFNRVELDLNEQRVKLVEQRITDHKADLLSGIPPGSISRSRWTWEESAQLGDAGAHFRRCFSDDPVLRRLFSREAL
ncbi:MAG: hypothetical protein Alpg2KO_21670 [Alphaproteobacteria bacterium]